MIKGRMCVWAQHKPQQTATSRSRTGQGVWLEAAHQGKQEVCLAESHLGTGCKILTLNQGLQMSEWGGQVREKKSQPNPTK